MQMCDSMPPSGFCVCVIPSDSPSVARPAVRAGMMEATMAALNGGGVAGGRARLSRESRPGSGASPRGPIAAAGSSSRALTHQSSASTGRFGQSEAVGGGGQGRSPFGVWMHARHEAAKSEVFLPLRSAVTDICSCAAPLSISHVTFCVNKCKAERASAHALTARHATPTGREWKDR